MKRPLALLALSVLSACSGRPVDEWCRAYFDALSAQDQRCGMPKDVADALASQQQDFNCPGFKRLLDSGQVAYDASQGDRCLERIAAAGCASAASSGDDPCGAALTGRAAVGQPCYDGRECVAGSYCKGSTCPSACAAYAKLGSSCAGVSCEPGSFCAAGTCVPPAVEGEGCLWPDHPNCGSGLWCGAISDTCRRLGAVTLAAACEGPQDCAAGFFCRGFDEAHNLSGTCLASKAVGDACAATECGYGLFCKQGKCVDAPRVGEGCGSIDGDQASCALGWCKLAAATAAGTCMALVKTGGPCEPAAESSCTLFSSCEPDTMTCVLRACTPPAPE